MRLRRGWPYAALIFALAGCKTPPREASTERPDAAAPAVAVAAVDAAAEAASEATPPVASEEPTFAMPSVPPRADAELVAIASSMCAATYREDAKKKLLVGCRKPPPFKGAGRAPDGKLERFAGDDVMTFCGISIGARGAFTGASKKQVLVTIENCRDESSNDGWNGSTPGSAALVENVDGRWKTIATIGAVNTDRCRVVHEADGRDDLFCQSRYDGGSVGTAHYFFTLAFRDGKLDARTAAFLYDDVDNWMCVAHETQPVYAPTGLTKLRIANVAVRDRSVTIDVDRAHALPSPALETQLRALCRKNAPIAGVVPPPTRARIELIGDGKGTFRPSPASKALLDKWRSESPDVTQLDGAAPAKIDD